MSRAFEFRALPLDMQRKVVAAMPATDRFFFFCCSRLAGTLADPGMAVARSVLLALCVSEDSLDRIIYLLPESSRRQRHWITDFSPAFPGNFWTLLGLGQSTALAYQSGATRDAVLQYLLEAAVYSLATYSSTIRDGIRQFVAERYLMAVIDAMFRAIEPRQALTERFVQRLLNSIVRGGRVCLMAQFLTRFSKIGRDALNSALRIACEVNLVPEFSELLLRFY